MAKELTTEEVRAASRRGAAKSKLPSALERATLDAKHESLRLHFHSGVSVIVPVKAVSEIAKLPIADLRDVRASKLGDGLIFSAVGVGIYVPGLIRDLFGDAFAAALGKAGGRVKNPARAAASRANGRKGGRPRKAVA